MATGCAAIVLVVLCLALCCAPANAMENETEMTGGFVPVELVSDGSGTDDSVAPAQPEGGSSEGQATGDGQETPSADDASTSAVEEPQATVTSAPAEDPVDSAGTENGTGDLEGDQEVVHIMSDEVATEGDAESEQVDEAERGSDSVDFGRTVIVIAALVIVAAVVLVPIALRLRRKSTEPTGKHFRTPE